jgi:hypothetical protein
MAVRLSDIRAGRALPRKISTFQRLTMTDLSGLLFPEDVTSLCARSRCTCTTYKTVPAVAWDSPETQRGRRQGHAVLPEGIRTVPEKLKAAWEWPVSKYKQEIRSSLGLCTYYRGYISGFADIANHLTKLTEVKQAFQWIPPSSHWRGPSIGRQSLLREVHCWHTCKWSRDWRSSLTSTGRTEPVTACHSKTLNKTARKCSVSRRELLAIMTTLEHFHK